MEPAVTNAAAPAAADVELVLIAACHEEGWRDLWKGFAEALDAPLTEEAIAATWGWLCDPAHTLEGLVAVSPGGRLVGLAHFHAMPKPLRGREGGYLADLFVDPAFRRQGIGRMLFDAVMDIGRDRGWSHVRWVTPDNNQDVIDLYDRVARRVPVITFDLGL